MGLCASSDSSTTKPEPTQQYKTSKNETISATFVFDPSVHVNADDDAKKINDPPPSIVTDDQTVLTSSSSLKRKRNTLLQRIASKMRSNTNKVHDFKPSITFLTIISSPTTHFDVYGATLLAEVMRTISCEYCFLNMVDDVREQVLSCYFPFLNINEEKSKRKPIKPYFWVSSLDDGIIGATCKSGHAYNLENVQRHQLFDRKSDCPPILQNTLPISYCIEPIRYMGDSTRIIGSITVVNKDRNTDIDCITSFSKRDAMQLLQICLQASDSMYRQRIRAIESNGDDDASDILSHYDSDHQSTKGLAPVPENKRISAENDEVTPNMMVSPVSKHLVSSESDGGGGGDFNSRPSLLRKTNRNEASSKDLFLYHWPSVSAISRGYPESAIGVPLDFRTLEFSALDYSAERLERFVLSIMRDTGLVDYFSIPPARLIRWTRAVRISYQDNPFHNWYHGFSVFHFSYYQLYVTDISAFLHPLDVFGLLIAALCHDSDHPGLSNQHLIDSENDLSIHYNDVSVLENHHAYICSELLRNDSTKISCYLDKQDQKELRKIVITAILHTDMSKHNKTCQSIMDRDKLRPFRSDSVTDRQTLLNITIHCADLSAQVLPWITASKWEERISQEFSAQAKKEIELGMKPSPIMINLDDMKVRGKGQMGFIDYVLVKLWDPMSMMFKELRPCYDNLIKNRKFYEQRWKTGRSGAPMPLPTNILKISKRGSVANCGSQSNNQKYLINTTQSNIHPLVIAHNVNKARKKFIGYGQKRGSPAKASHV